MEAVDSACAIAIIAAYVFYAGLLQWKKVFNVNLRVLLLFLPLSDLANPIIFVLSAANLPPPTIRLLLQISSVGWNMIFLTPCSLAVERLFATLSPSVYEIRFIPIVALGAILVEALLIASTMAIESLRGVPSLLSVALKFAILISAIIIIFLLPMITNRMHGRVLNQRFIGSDYSNVIKNRYHFNENYRSIRVLRVFLPFYVSCILIQVLCFVAIMLLFPRILGPFFLYSTSAFVTFREIGGMLIVVYNHPTLRRSVQNFLWKPRPIHSAAPSLPLSNILPGVTLSNTTSWQTTRTSSADTKPQILNAQGQALAFSAAHETDLYFAKLKNAWE